MFKTGFLSSAKNWDGWNARVRTDGTVVQVQRSHALPIEKKEYKGTELTDLIAEKSKGLEDVTVTLSGTGGGQGFRDEKFLVVAGWSSELTPTEAAEAKRVNFG